MNLIDNRKIQVFITPEEADVLMQSLCVFVGPFGKSRDELTHEKDIEHHDKKMQLVENMKSELGSWLMDEYAREQQAVYITEHQRNEMRRIASIEAMAVADGLYD